MKLTLFESAYKKNINFIKTKLGFDRFLLAVVKSDAYGLGLESVCRILLNQGIDFFAVYHLEEACFLQKKFSEIKKILILGRLFKDEKEESVCRGFDLSIHHIDDLVEIVNISEHFQIRTRVHLYLDTGMRSMGVDSFDLKKNLCDIRRLLSSSFIIREGLFSHMALRNPTLSAIQFYQSQLECFKTLKNSLNLSFRFFHTDNSRAFLLNERQAVCNMIRPGLMLHGLDSCGNVLSGMELPFSLTTHISLIKYIRWGENINYNQEWQVEKDMRVAILPVGFGDGIVHFQPQSTFVWIQGRFFPVVGSTNMNNIFVDISSCEDICVGSPVELVSNQRGKTLFPSNWISSSSSSYQFLSSLKYRKTEICSI